MITKKELTVLGTLNSKLCHDLIAPAGAAEIGLSLIEDGIMDKETVDMAADSLRRLVSKLSYFRACYSFSKSPDTPSLNEAQNVLGALLKADKKQLTWKSNLTESPSNEGVLSKKILNVLLLALPLLKNDSPVVVTLKESAEAIESEITVQSIMVETLIKKIESSRDNTAPSDLSPHNFQEKVINSLFGEEELFQYAQSTSNPDQLNLIIIHQKN